MTDNKKYTILKTLISKELKEICKQHELRDFSGLKQKELAKFVSALRCFVWVTQYPYYPLTHIT